MLYTVLLVSWSHYDSTCGFAFDDYYCPAEKFLAQYVSRFTVAICSIEF